MNTGAVILSAGLSTRCFPYKLTLPFKGKTLFENCIENIYPYADKLYVVTGYNKLTLTELLGQYPKVENVENSDYLNGMTTSVLAGLKRAEEERLFILPADYPLIKGSTFRALLQRSEPIVIPVFNGKKGHPLFINREIRNEIITEKDTNLSRYLAGKQKYYLDVDDEGVLFDVDTLADYERVRRFE